MTRRPEPTRFARALSVWCRRYILGFWKHKVARPVRRVLAFANQAQVAYFSFILSIVIMHIALWRASPPDSQNEAIFIAAIAAAFGILHAIGPLIYIRPGSLFHRPAWQLTAITGGTILSFTMMMAALHSMYGMSLDNETTHEPITAIYFAIVTLTTLGYGDVTPTPAMRLPAALHALLGYLALGLMVAFTSEAVATSRRKR